MWKLEFWKLEIKFGNRNFEDYLKKKILKINEIIIIIIIINKCENMNFGNWKLNSKIEKLEFHKLGIKFGNRNFEELFKDRIFKSK